MGSNKKDVQPGHETSLEICTSGRPADLATGDYVTIKDLDGCQISISGNVVSWNPMDQQGWQRNAVTGKSLTLSCVAKRNYGDEGNDYIASLALATGSACESAAKITFPNGDHMHIPCVINVKNNGGANTLDLGQLEFDILADGAPLYTSEVSN